MRLGMAFTVVYCLEHPSLLLSLYVPAWEVTGRAGGGGGGAVGSGGFGLRVLTEKNMA